MDDFFNAGVLTGVVDALRREERRTGIVTKIFSEKIFLSGSGVGECEIFKNGSFSSEDFFRKIMKIFEK